MSRAALPYDLEDATTVPERSHVCALLCSVEDVVSNAFSRDPLLRELVGVFLQDVVQPRPPVAGLQEDRLPGAIPPDADDPLFAELDTVPLQFVDQRLFGRGTSGLPPTPRRGAACTSAPAVAPMGSDGRSPASAPSVIVRPDGSWHLEAPAGVAHTQSAQWDASVCAGKFFVPTKIANNLEWGAEQWCEGDYAPHRHATSRRDRGGSRG
jgi:hypothetical protein